MIELVFFKIKVEKTTTESEIFLIIFNLKNPDSTYTNYTGNNTVLHWCEVDILCSRLLKALFYDRCASLSGTLNRF